MILRIITTTSLLLCATEAAVIRTPVTTGPFGGSQSFTLTDNTGATIAISGRNICTADVPSSGCYTSAIVTGGGSVQFLLSNNGSPLHLLAGEVLSDQPATGMWGTNSLNRHEFLISRSSPRDGTFTAFNDEYTIGFRVREAEGNYRYGWLEAKSNSPVVGASFKSLALSDGVTNSLVVTPIPEPTSSFFIVLATTTLAWRTRRRI